MPLGYCLECHKLTHLRPAPTFSRTGVRQWVPLPHETPRVHRGCGAKVTEIDRHALTVSRWSCEACGEVGDAVVEGGESCERGPRRPI